MHYDIVVSVTNDLNTDRRMHRICNSLHADGNVVMLMGSRTKHSPELDTKPFDQQRIQTLFTNGFLFYCEYNVRLLTSLLFTKCKIYYSVDLDTLLAVGLASLIRRRKFVFDAHEIFEEVPELQNKPFRKWVWRRIGHQFVSSAEKRLTVSPSLARELGQQYNCHFDVVRNLPLYKGVLPSHRSSNLFTIVYQGMVNQGRGVKEVIQSISSLSNVELWIIGDGDLYNELHSFADKLNYSNRIVFLGWLPPSELHDKISNADLGVNLLEKKSKSYYFSLANKFFDYIMAEVPILSMNFPEYMHLNERYNIALLLDSADPNLVKEAIQKLMEDKDLVYQMKANCAKAKKILNWESEEYKLLHVIDQVLN